jgi:hypothetical protein
MTQEEYEAAVLKLVAEQSARLSDMGAREQWSYSGGIAYVGEDDKGHWADVWCFGVKRNRVHAASEDALREIVERIVL